MSANAWNTEEGRKAESMLGKEGMLEWPSFLGDGLDQIRSEGKHWVLQSRLHGATDWGHVNYVPARLAEDSMNGAAIRWLRDCANDLSMEIHHDDGSWWDCSVRVAYEDGKPDVVIRANGDTVLADALVQLVVAVNAEWEKP